MSALSDETLKKIEKVFAERGVTLRCPRCGNGEFVIVNDGYVTHVIQPPDFSPIALQGQHIPSVATVCQKCGFISLHSLIVLGLYPTQETDTK